MPFQLESTYTPSGDQPAAIQALAQGELHRLANIGSEPVVFIEVQSGSYFGEDDIERIEDDYNR